MAVVVGGLRTRFIYDSVFNALHDGMELLGWMTVSQSHLPVTFTSEPIIDTDEVKLNAMGMGEGPMFDREAEIGSNMSMSEYAFFVDVFAENGPIGRAMANDMRDLIMGRHGGRTVPAFTIYDYSLATPTSVGWVDVERVNIYRETNPTRPWQRFWYTIRFDVIDNYEAVDPSFGGSVYGEGAYGS